MEETVSTQESLQETPLRNGKRIIQIWKEALRNSRKDSSRFSRICREQTRDLYDVWVFYIDVDISDITLQETEVVDVKWVTCEELIKMERKGELHPLLNVSSVTKKIILWRNSMRTSICGIDCMKCELKETCFGCAVTDGHPFHGGCVLAACCLSNGYEHCGKCHNEK